MYIKKYQKIKKVQKNERISERSKDLKWNENKKFINVKYSIWYKFTKNIHKWKQKKNPNRMMFNDDRKNILKKWKNLGKKKYP